MDEQPKRYPHLPPEEEAKLRGVPANVIKVEREMNARLNQPEFLDLINEFLGRRKAEPDTPAGTANPPPQEE